MTSDRKSREPMFVPVFVVQQEQEVVTGVVFSPELPDTAVVLYQDHPPFLHDLRKAGLALALQQAAAGVQPEAVVLDDETVLYDKRFRTPAQSAAYRGTSGEVAIAFGQADSFVHRIFARKPGNLEAICVENVSRVVYSADGELLAVGTGDGLVMLYRLTDDGEPVQVKSANLESGIKALSVDELSGSLFAATDMRGPMSVCYQTEQEANERHRMNVEGEGTRLTRFLCNATSTDGLVAWGGVGNEVWLANTLTAQGQFFPLVGLDRINGLAFPHGLDGQLIVTGDACVKLLTFGLDSDRRPQFEPHSLTYENVPGGTIVGAHRYGAMICPAYAVPAD